MEKKEENIIKQSDTTSPSLGAYAPSQAGYGLDLSSARRAAEFEDNHSRLWKDTAMGRGAIRLFSRGVLGAGAFAWGGYYAGAKLRLYNPRLPAKNMVQRIARFFDIAVAPPIKGLVNALGHDGEKFLTFRPTSDWSGYGGKMGRSLGHEVTDVTFNFSAMSVGDFWGRKIADTLDPNVPKDWVNENGGIDYGKATARFGHNWWTALTYAAGEDWAMGVPYVLTMRHISTPLINKAFPGYAVDFDRNGCGGSLLVNDHGRVRGNFTAAGVFNLWERFTTYNVGTLMFREAYTWTANRLKHFWEFGERAPLVPFDPKNPDRTPLETGLQAAKDLSLWASSNVATATMYMLPAVPFFWMSRVPQHKYRGLFIHPEKGILKYISGGEEIALRAHSLQVDPHFTPQTPVFFSKTREAAANPFAGGFSPYAKNYSIWDWLLNPIGRLTDRLRNKADATVGEWINKHPDIMHDALGLELDVTSQGRKKLQSGRALTSTYVNAALAYTPYFWAKSDVMAHAWDTGRTDVAMERIMKGFGTLNVPEAGKGITELGYALRNEPLPDPQREAEAQHRIETKLTPPDSSYDITPIAARHEQHTEQLETINPQGFTERLRDHKQQANNRMAQFRRQLNPKSHASAVEEAALRAPTYAEQERIRREAQTMDLPPGTTVH